MAQLLSSIKSEQRLNAPGGPFPWERYQLFVNDTLKELTDAQLFALILNESCVHRGRGFFVWFPKQMHNVTMLFYTFSFRQKTVLTHSSGQQGTAFGVSGPPVGRRSSELLYVIDSCKAPRMVCGYAKRFFQPDNNLLTHLFEAEYHTMALKKRVSNGLPVDLDAIGITCRIFRPDSDDDIISWQENPKGNLLLHYRDGAFCFGKLNEWQEYAQRTEVSSFAFDRSKLDAGPLVFTPTPSYQVRYGDIPDHTRTFLELFDVDRVVTAFHETFIAPRDKPRRPDQSLF